MRLERVSDQPILTPRQHVTWESDAICNAAVVRVDDKVHMFYRGIYHPGWSKGLPGAKYDSCIGHGVSEDGIHFERADEPVLACDTVRDGHEIHDPEDPRVTALDGKYYMTYCNWNGRSCQTHLASSEDLQYWTNHGLVMPFESFGMNKNAVIFSEKIGGRYAMLHRPEPRECLDFSKHFDWNWWSRSGDCLGGIRLAFSDDMQTWSYENECMMMPRPDRWDCLKVGTAGPPIKTDQGWLMVYHAVGHGDVYRLGIALLDLQDPSIVLRRQDEPILQPELDWELEGDVPNVVFSCGCFLIDTELWVYYGGADRVIGLAKGDVSEFLGI